MVVVEVLEVIGKAKGALGPLIEPLLAKEGPAAAAKCASKVKVPAEEILLEAPLVPTKNFFSMENVVTAVPLMTGAYLYYHMQEQIQLSEDIASLDLTGQQLQGALKAEFKECGKLGPAEKLQKLKYLEPEVQIREDLQKWSDDKSAMVSKAPIYHHASPHEEIHQQYLQTRTIGPIEDKYLSDRIKNSDLLTDTANKRRIIKMAIKEENKEAVSTQMVNSIFVE